MTYMLDADTVGFVYHFLIVTMPDITMFAATEKNLDSLILTPQFLNPTKFKFNKKLEFINLLIGFK